MAVTNVTTTLNGVETELDKVGDTYETNLYAPDRTTAVYATAYDMHGNSTTQMQMLEVDNDWITPKTDWLPTDFINYTDINRIIGNLNYLRFLATYFFGVREYETMLEKVGYTYYRFASEINAIEKNLEILNTDTFNYDIGETKEYFPNNGGFDYAELNRIEGAELRLYGVLYGSYRGIHTLAFTLGGEKGIKP